MLPFIEIFIHIIKIRCLNAILLLYLIDFIKMAQIANFLENEGVDTEKQGKILFNSFSAFYTNSYLFSNFCF